LQSYKAQRGPAPPGFTPDLRNLQLLLGFMRVATASVPGYEADDVLAGAAAQAAAAGYAVGIYSSDQDLWQVRLLVLSTPCRCWPVLPLEAHMIFMTQA
jgi:DNA polymerase-1